MKISVGDVYKNETITIIIGGIHDTKVSGVYIVESSFLYSQELVGWRIKELTNWIQVQKLKRVEG